MTSIVDPFDRVLLLKNIDNAILTSFRTLTKQNNVISHTMKVIHTKFTPKILSKHVKNQYKRAQQTLYPVSEVESYGDQYSESEREQQQPNQKHAQVSEPKLNQNRHNQESHPNLSLKDDQTEEGIN